MAVADYKKYLAENIIHGSRTVTYRSLGRALRVHCTLAKQMLYDFYQNENSKKPSSVHATYVLTGVPKPAEPSTNGVAANGNGDNDGDIMASSPYISSSMPNPEDESDQTPLSAILLAREEDLKGDLQPTILQDLNVLTDVSREMLVSHAKEDPLEYGNEWGMIQNTNVRRRTGARPPPPPPAPSNTVPAKRPVQSEPSQTSKEEAKNEDLPKPVQRHNSASSGKSTEKALPAKKEKGSLFSSFAKVKPKLKKEGSATSATSGAESAAPSGAEDVVLDDASEDEQEEPFPVSRKEGPGDVRESRKEREERLRKMMEDDDEDEEMLDATEPPMEPETIDKPPPKQEDLKVEATVKGGRRRGRRQVMKKAVKKDSEGYLVTVEETSWESFSEDEPAPPPPKKRPVVSAPKGKAGAKPGQGNIMSFFGKK
ncbi:hypothetical protein BDW75DRAFT_248108 [Aspergillus navahoensis]